MDSDDFLKSVTDYEAWLRKSRELRDNGDVLWDTFTKELGKWAKSIKEMDSEENEEDIVIDIDKALSHLRTSQMLYGLALETVFKANIIKECPEDIELKMSADGTGTVYQVEVKQLGVSLNSGHDLTKLAHRANVFDRGRSIFSEDSDYGAFKNVLEHLNDMIVWQARYPVSLKSNQQYKKPQDLPAKILNHYIRDWVDPVLDHYYKELETTAT